MPQPRLAIVPQPARQWSYVMIGEEVAAEALDRIYAGSKPLTTLRVWHAIVFSTDWSTNEVTAKAPALATKAKVSEMEVRRALPYLASIGVLKRVGRGRYEVNPDLAWKGDMTARERAAKKWGTPVS